MESIFVKNVQIWLTVITGGIAVAIVLYNFFKKSERVKQLEEIMKEDRPTRKFTPDKDLKLPQSTGEWGDPIPKWKVERVEYQDGAVFYDALIFHPIFKYGSWGMWRESLCFTKAFPDKDDRKKATRIDYRKSLCENSAQAQQMVDDYMHEWRMANTKSQYSFNDSETDTRNLL